MKWCISATHDERLEVTKGDLWLLWRWWQRQPSHCQGSDRDKVRSEPCWQNNNSAFIFSTVTHADRQIKRPNTHTQYDICPQSGRCVLTQRQILRNLKTCQSSFSEKPSPLPSGYCYSRVKRLSLWDRRERRGRTGAALLPRWRFEIPGFSPGLGFLWTRPHQRQPGQWINFNPISVSYVGPRLQTPAIGISRRKEVLSGPWYTASLGHFLVRSSNHSGVCW